MRAHHDWSALVERLLAEVKRRPALGSPSEDSAWEDLRGRLLRMARLLVDAEHVDDVVQAVALKLQSVDALSRMRAARSPEGYAFMMVRNAGIDLDRRRWRAPVALPEAGGDAADTAPGQHELLEQRVRGEELEGILADLSDSERLLLHLRFWENLSIAEIAARLEIPYSTVAVRMFRLLRRLRPRLNASG